MEEYFKHLVDHFGCEDICDHAAKTGNLNLLKWARAHGREYPWTASTSVIATHKNSFELLKWAVKNGCPVDERITELASMRGYIDILKWAHDEDLPFSSLVCENAAFGGHLLILKWLSEQKYELNNYWTYFHAASNQKWNVVEWMMNRGYSNLHNVFNIHKLQGHFMATANLLKLNKEDGPFVNQDQVKVWLLSITTIINEVTYFDLGYLIKSFI